MAAHDIESFVVDGVTYLAIANMGDDHHSNVESLILQWSGNFFVVYQRILTRGASAFESFMIDGELYLASANYHDDITGFYTDSMIYKWNREQKSFNEYQNISTAAAYDLSFFVVCNSFYIAVSNFRTNVEILKWNGSYFKHFQYVDTKSAYGLESFVIDGLTYLAVAIHITGSHYDTNSTMYRWNGTEFVRFQDIPTLGALNWESFTIGKDSYLAVANYRRLKSDSNVDSVIYRWNGGAFEVFQKIATHAATGWRSFHVNGKVFLAVSNSAYLGTHITNSVIYKWNGVKFVAFEEIMTKDATAWESFEIDGINYLAVANEFDGSNYCIDSIVYSNAPIFEQ